MGEFEKSIKGHDWSFEYSDDHRVWVRGCRSQDRLREIYKSLNCPFSYLELENFAANRVIDLFAEESPGEWYRQPRVYKYIAPMKKEYLLEREKFDEITAWLEENDSE
jgi:hypothetical protein